MILHGLPAVSRPTAKFAVALMLVALAAALTPTPVQAANFVVDSQTDAIDAIPGDGVCATVALAGEGVRCTLRAATMEANALAGPDAINLPAGAYVRSLTLPPSGVFPCTHAADSGDSFKLLSDITLVGAGTSSTTIDGGLGCRAVTVGSGATVAISGVTIRNGRELIVGGGILNSGGLTLTDVVVRGNEVVQVNNSGSWGGGISSGGSLTMLRVTVTNNTSTTLFGSGGSGVWSTGPLSITDSAFSQNAGGSAVLISVPAGTTATLMRVTLTENPNLNTVAISNTSQGAITFEDSLISNSHRGILNFGSLSVIGTTIRDMQGTPQDPGQGIENHGTLHLTRSTVNGISGVALFNRSGATATVENVTMTGNNSGTIAGAAISNAGTMTVLNATIAGNVASVPAGQSVFTAAGTSLSFKNSIVSGAIDAPLCLGPITSLGHNLETGTTCGFTGPGDIRRTDPHISDLFTHGGPTLTHRLLPGSPAIDAGTNSGCPSTDQRGQPRPREGDLSGSPVCDIGAYELQEPYPPEADLSVTLADSPDPVSVGTPLTYTAVVGNNGFAPATGTTLTVSLPGGVTFSSATPSQGSCAGSGPVICQLGTVNAGATPTVSIVVTPTTGGNKPASAQVTSSVTDPNGGNNLATTSTLAQAVCSPRPNVGLQTARIGPGQLRGTLSVGRTGVQPNNDLVSIQVVELDNATATVNGAAVATGQTVPLPNGTTQAQVIVTRAAAGPFGVRLTVTDDCGEWKTLVGGGRDVP